MTTSDSAEHFYYNGLIYTADAQNRFCDALVIRDGCILAIGTKETLREYVSSNTQCHDLQGKTVIPGLIDAHLHPFWGAMQLDSCHLNYDYYTIPQILAKIQAHLDLPSDRNPDKWLKVFGWYQQGVLPKGTQISRFDLDTLNTERPIIILSSDCHSLVANSCALQRLGIDENTSKPNDGQIRRNELGQLTGVLEDGPAMRAFEKTLNFTESERLNIGLKMQHHLNQQGVTTVMDARFSEMAFSLFQQMQLQQILTLRIFGAYEITPTQVKTPEEQTIALQKAQQTADQYNQHTGQSTPFVAIKHIKLFVDGVLESPLMSAALLQPYQTDLPTLSHPHYGDYYFSAQTLNRLIPEIAAYGFHPHLHTVGDGAIEISLNAIETMRNHYPDKDIRPSLAHNELVAPHQYQRFSRLATFPLLSFQWANISDQDRVDEIKMFGESRFKEREPAGKFIDAGAIVAFGSDWPIDELDEWYAFQVAMTRQGIDTKGQLGERLDNDRNLTLIEVLRSATINAAKMLDMDRYIGSLEVGKFADFAILQQPLFSLLPQEIAQISVDSTIIGGVVVYQSNKE